MPKKKKKQEQVLETWNQLKAKIMNLKTNHKDNWALVKVKSEPQTSTSPRVFAGRDNNAIQFDKLQARLEQVRQLVVKGDLVKLKKLYEQGGI